MGRAFTARDLAEDVAGDIATLLDSGAHARDGRVAPDDIAVLVPPTAAAPARSATALEAARVPAVITGAGSVFGDATRRDEWLGCWRRWSARRTRSARTPPR